MEKVIKITWDETQIKEWYLSEENIKLALNNYFENKSFDVEELIEVDGDEDNEQYVNIDIEEIKNDLANKEQQLSDLLKFIEINDGYQFGYLEHEIDNLKMEILNLNSYLIELESDCDCPFCKIDELENENDGLRGENINLYLQLKEQEQDIEGLKLTIKSRNKEIEKLKKENESHINSLSDMRELINLYFSLLANFR